MIYSLDKKQAKILPICDIVVNTVPDVNDVGLGFMQAQKWPFSNTVYVSIEVEHWRRDVHHTKHGGVGQ